MPDDLASVLHQLRAGLEAQYGDAGPESDVDVLVVLKGEVNPLAEIHANEFLVADLSLAHDLVLSCVCLSVAEYQDEADLFLRNVRREALPWL